MVISIKLMADYECHSLWGMDRGQIGEVDPEVLPISEELKELLRDWGCKYTQTLNRADPASSGLKDPDAEQEFNREEIELWKRLQHELGPSFRVHYYNSISGEVLPPENKVEDS